MKVFHLDYNTAAFRADYLRAFLERLRRLGYDTLIWELEGYVRWQSCPSSAAPDALMPEEFRNTLLCHAEELGFANIPLLQTLGHVEYVLDCPEFFRFRENPDENSPYCPNAPELAEFLDRWIGEIAACFGSPAYFHLGCDEVWRLGKTCPRCKDTPVGELISAHILRVAGMVRKRGMRPVIWADMALIHPELTQGMPRDLILCDWRYEIYNGCGSVWCWDEKGGALTAPEDIPVSIRKVFQSELYPGGKTEPERFYTSHFLRNQGFDVLLASSTSCAGDNLFAGRAWFHACNVADFLAEAPDRFVVTSWTVHLFPYELQPAISLLPYRTLEAFRERFPRDRYGVGPEAFWTAAECLAEQSCFTSVRTSGHDKTFRKVAPDAYLRKIRQFREKGTLDEELLRSRRCLEQYRQGVKRFEALLHAATANQQELGLWHRAARCLANRAETAIWLMTGEGCPELLLRELFLLKKELSEWYEQVMYPHRAAEIIHILFAPAQFALQNQKEKP